MHTRGHWFDITATAGWYSAIAGLLAGFALLSVLLPLDHETKDRGEAAERAAASGIIVFTSAFFSLIILAFTYAVLAGRSTAGTVGGLVVHEQQINGAASGLATLLVIIGLREVLRLYGGRGRILLPAQQLITRVAALYGPMILIGFQFRNAMDVGVFRTSRADSSCVADVPEGVWVNVAISAAGIIAILAIALPVRSPPRSHRGPELIGRFTPGFTIGVAVWTSVVLPILAISITAGPPLEHATVALTAVASFAFGAAAWSSR